MIFFALFLDMSVFYFYFKRDLTVFLSCCSPPLYFPFAFYAYTISEFVLTFLFTSSLSWFHFPLSFMAGGLIFFLSTSFWVFCKLLIPLLKVYILPVTVQLCRGHHCCGVFPDFEPLAFYQLV